MSVEEGCSEVAPMVPAAEDEDSSEEDAHRTASFNLGSSYEVIHRGSSASYRYICVCVKTGSALAVHRMALVLVCGSRPSSCGR